MNINVKIALPSLIGLVLTILSIQLLWQPLQLEKSKISFEAHTNELITLVDSPITLYLLENDLSSLYSVLDQLEGNYGNYLKNITLYENNGAQLYPFLKRNSKVAIDDSELIHIIHPIYFKGKTLGRLEVDIDWEQEKLIVVGDIQSVVNIIILLMLMSLLIGTISQYQIIYKPLKKLKGAARNIAHGNFKAELPLANNDEIGDLTNSFHKMMLELEFEKNAVNHHTIVSITDNNGLITSVNNKFLAISGYTRAELIGKSHGMIKSGIHHLEFYNDMWATITQGNVWHGEFCNRKKTGELYWVNSTIVPFLDKDGIPERYMSIRTDMSEHKKNEEKLKLAATVFTHTREGIIITDATGSIMEVNDHFTEITGYSREDVIGQSPRVLQSDRQPPEFYAEMWKTTQTKGYWIGTILNSRKNGEVYAENLTLSAVKDAIGNISHYVALFSDITNLNNIHQSELKQMAHYDALTKLPNRVLLADRLNQAMVQSQRRHCSLAVAFLDLDDFKVVNDTYGHAVGDELLMIVSKRMKDALRDGDTLARIGGDEFVVVLPDLINFNDYQSVLERVLLAASKAIKINGSILQVSASIGVSTYPQDGTEADILMRHADQAMYQAKHMGKNCYHLFDITHDDAINIQQENCDNISAAFDRREFILYYQPKVNMATGEIVGAEALIRWQHPERGLVPPLDFLPIIENHAISLDIGEWVIDTALKQLSHWQNIGIILPISVNISAYQLQQADFVERLTVLLAAHPEVSPSNLELEILETSALNDVIQVSATMQACIALGVHFSFDDFGTGYSSLTYLRRLPARLIKIDQSFVRDMLDDEDDLAIIAGVVSLAKAFQRDVIAEGVETIEHGTALLALGCELAQGYGIAKPMHADDIPVWISGWKPDVSWNPE